MNNGKNQKVKKMIVSIVVAVILAVLVLFYLCNRNDNKKAGVVWDSGKQVINESQTDYISIRAFESLTFQAGKYVQPVEFYNPKSNNYYMIMSIVFDGKALWTSNKVFPGYGFHEIEVFDTPNVGEYSAQYVIKCFDEVTNQEVNGCTFNFTLYVE